MPTPPPPKTDWNQIAKRPDYQQLLAKKRAFLIPATIFFIAYYFALPILVGYFPGLMSRPVLGPVNLAYLFALSQFVMAWILAWIYVRRAHGFDQIAERIRQSQEPPA